MQFDEHVENVLPKFVILLLEKRRKKQDFEVLLEKLKSLRFFSVHEKCHFIDPAESVTQFFLNFAAKCPTTFTSLQFFQVHN